MDEPGMLLHAVMPLVFTWALWGVLFRRLRKRGPGFPLLDVGMLFATVVAVYVSFPLIGVMLEGGEYSEFSDNRLRLYSPSVHEFGLFSWKYVLVLGSFVASYVLMRRRTLHVALSTESSQDMVRPVLVAVVGLSLYLVAIWLIFDVRQTTTYGDSYYENVSRYASLPLLLQQVTSRVAGVLFVAKLALVLLIAINFRKPLWRYGGAVWLLYELMSPFMQLGARTTAVLLFLGFVLAYNAIVKRLSIRSLVIVGSVFLAAFLLQGLLRSEDILEEAGFVSGVFAANEFLSLFATAYDLEIRMTYGGVQVPWQLFLADFLRLVPQQVLPFEKMDPAIWYLDLIGFRGEGVGFTFGLIAESVIGLGDVELLFRGAVLGIGLAVVHNAMTRRADRFLWVLFYLWICVEVYLSFRSSTLFWLSSVVFEFVPLALFLRLFARRRGGYVATRSTTSVVG